VKLPLAALLLLAAPAALAQYIPPVVGSVTASNASCSSTSQAYQVLAGVAGANSVGVSIPTSTATFAFFGSRDGGASWAPLPGGPDATTSGGNFTTGVTLSGAAWNGVVSVVGMRQFCLIATAFTSVAGQVWVQPSTAPVVPAQLLYASVSSGGALKVGSPNTAGAVPTQVSVTTSATRIFLASPFDCSVTVQNESNAQVATCGSTNAVTAGAIGITLKKGTAAGDGTGGSMSFPSGADIWCIADANTLNVGIQPFTCP
jgi:hypothetical protein